jgi:hypothetical protein
MGTPELAHNITLLGHPDQGGRGDGVQVMVGGGGAYVGHMFSDGVTVLDVRDPRNPRPVNYLPAAPGTWSLHLQLADGLLLVVNAMNMFAAEAFARRVGLLRPLGRGGAGRAPAARPRPAGVRHLPERRGARLRPGQPLHPPAVRAGLVVTEPVWTRSGWCRRLGW